MPSNTALQTDKGKLSRLLHPQKPRQLAFAAELSCYVYMALSEFETKKVEKTVSAFIERRRPPAHIRPELDLGFRVSGQSVEIFEVRPVWKQPNKKMEHPVAKATYVKSRAVWKVYWMRADLKWHSYPPAPTVGTVEKFLSLVSEDKHACFFG